jgi:4-aminobutyrate aminotransferase/(S)-3-amino-2-methylpropionate transaminase
VTSTFGRSLPRVVTHPPGPNSLQLARRLRAVESRNVTWLGERFPVFWEAARGANVRDVDGNVYLDLTSAFGVALAGHAHPHIKRSVRWQSDRLIHGMGDIHPADLKVMLLERLAGLAPWPETRGVLASGGSEAVEIALKTALLRTGRSGLLAFRGGYHGLTLGALSVTAREYFRAPFHARLFDGVAFAPFPDPRDGERAASAALDEVERALAKGAPSGDPIGAVIVEPVQARAGVRVPPDGFMPALSERAHAAGALVIADELFTGTGRCGAPLASPLVGLEPDLICLGKALGGGLPLSACIGRADVMDAWPPSPGEALHTSTFLGHPLACAAALASLDLLAGGLGQRAAKLGRSLLRGLRGALASEPGVAEVRGLGLLIGIELGRDDPRTAQGAGARIAEAALAEGLLVLPAGDDGSVVELAPPAVLTPLQRGFAIDGIARVIRGVMAG